MAKTKDTAADYTMQEKIMALYELQKIDSKIDEINKVKGELPGEVQDLEDEIAGLKTRVQNITRDIENLNQLIKQRKDEKDQNNALIAKYKEQQDNVRNNREFNSLSQEIEYQELQNQLCDKHLKEYAAEIKVKKHTVEESEAEIADRKIDLQNKQNELATIDQETAKEIEDLKEQDAKAREKIDERLLIAYSRIRGNARNGLAVVTVKRDACGGCYNRIPPQRQVEIRQGKKIIVCEYCGRILVSEDTLDEE